VHPHDEHYQRLGPLGKHARAQLRDPAAW
jgi:hypothetical protein